MEPDETEVVTPEVTEEVVTPEVAEAPEETIEEVKAKLAKAEEIADNQRIRAEKAEKKAKETPAPPAGSYSLTDQVAIANAKVHEDDIARVEKFAKDENLPIKDALKHPELKAILALRQETRTTAEATNVAPSRRSNGAPSDDVLLSNAAAGKLPDSDADIDRLIAAKMKGAKR
jgi:hypothetical protein